jgi:Type II CAAX prenyl endopeptidase Rce1-like
MLIGSTFLLLMLWGPHGNLEMLGYVWEDWSGPGSDPIMRKRIIGGIPWDQEWISFGAGMALVVIIPVLLIRFVYHQRLRDFGLGLPRRDRRLLTILSMLTLFTIGLPLFMVSARNAEIRATYPMYRGGFDSLGAFWAYEVGCLAFYIAIEFIFRGYLLLGLYGACRGRTQSFCTESMKSRMFGSYAIFVSMLSYTAWHLGKPLPELWGTLVWGIAAGSLVIAIESIWPIVLVHWLLNVAMDYLIVGSG